MKTSRLQGPTRVLPLFIALVLFMPFAAAAHCDGMDGPVVKAAQKALENGDVNLVLIWVREKDEAEIRDAFDRTLQVRKLGPEAKALADRYFFETLVRVHRAGEGAPYTGLKPAGRDLGPAVPLADEVIENGNIDDLVALITDEVRAGLMERFEHVKAARDYSPENVNAGREFVEAYVAFIHYAERAYEAAHHAAEGHFPEGEHPAAVQGS